VQPPIEPGNIDLTQRPSHTNPDGSVSTVLTKSFNFDGREVLLPTIGPDGTPLSDQQAIDLYKQTGKHLGVFTNPASATAYAKIIHRQQESNPPVNNYAQPSALDPTQIEQLRQSLLTHSGQLDPNNPNGLAARMSGPYSKIDQQGQEGEATAISNQFRPKTSGGTQHLDKRSQSDSGSFNVAGDYKGSPGAGTTDLQNWRGPATDGGAQQVIQVPKGMTPEQYIKTLPDDVEGITDPKWGKQWLLIRQKNGSGNHTPIA
jgi:hypothetical protein